MPSAYNAAVTIDNPFHGENPMPTYPKNLLEQSGVEVPPVGLYDAPDPTAFEPLVRPSHVLVTLQAQTGEACGNLVRELLEK